MSYYGGGQPGPGPDPNQQQPGDPYLGGPGGFAGQAPADPYAPNQAPPPGDPYYGQAPADPNAQQPPPPSGWQPPYQASPWQQPPAAPKSASSNAGAVLVGIFLVLLGVWFLFRDEIALDFGQLWPAAAVGLGGVMVVAAFIPRRRR